MPLLLGGVSLEHLPLSALGSVPPCIAHTAWKHKMHYVPLPNKTIESCFTGSKSRDNLFISSLSKHRELNINHDIFIVTYQFLNI